MRSLTRSSQLSYLPISRERRIRTSNLVAPSEVTASYVTATLLKDQFRETSGFRFLEDSNLRLWLVKPLSTN